MKNTAGFETEINLWEIVKWRFSRKKYVGNYTFYLGKIRLITAEDFETVRLENVKNPVNKTSITLHYAKPPRK